MIMIPKRLRQVQQYKEGVRDVGLQDKKATQQRLMINLLQALIEICFKCVNDD